MFSLPWSKNPHIRTQNFGVQAEKVLTKFQHAGSQVTRFLYTGFHCICTTTAGFTSLFGILRTQPSSPSKNASAARDNSSSIPCEMQKCISFSPQWNWKNVKSRPWSMKGPGSDVGQIPVSRNWRYIQAGWHVSNHSDKTARSLVKIYWKASPFTPLQRRRFHQLRGSIDADESLAKRWLNVINILTADV